MPSHHKLEHYLDAYIDAVGLGCESNAAPLFRSAVGRTGRLTDTHLSRIDVWKMVHGRAADAAIPTAIGCHTFRATGIADYLKNDGRIEITHRMAGHSNAKASVFYDRRDDDMSRDAAEWIRILKLARGQGASQ